ncbi:hypothetical protein AB4076_11090 [Dyella sp. 2RAF44]|uniref:hypothetical protein n=1 Tax=Dyella sp. 2RAF44 TaxID=3233000 RepID=UPI003F910200
MAAVEIYRRMPCEVWVAESGEIYSVKPADAPLAWFVGTYKKGGNADELRNRITLDLRERAQELPINEKSLEYDRHLEQRGLSRTRNTAEPFRPRRDYWRNYARARRAGHAIQADGRTRNHPRTVH